MTVLATTTTRRPSSGHVFVVPVVQEVSPKPASSAQRSAW
jgi:hypothetical protein